MTTGNPTLTFERLQPFLSTLLPGASENPSFTPLTADASTRRYYRLRWAAPATGYPASCVVMHCDPWPTEEATDFLTVGRHLRICGVRVPEVYGVQPEAGLMCLEDYGDRSLAAQWQHGDPEDRLRWGRQAVDELVKMHTRATQTIDPACPAFHLAFDVDKLTSELQFFQTHAVVKLWQQSLGPNDCQAWDSAYLALCAPLAAAARFFCHRDYHGWNVMAHDGSVGVLDFQDARMGPQPYDLASLLTDRGTADVLTADGTAALVAYYLDRWQAESGQTVDKDEFAWLFDMAAVQRCLKAIGTFAAMHVVHDRSQYLPSIPPTLAYLRPLMQRYRRLQPLADLLRRFTPL